MWSVVEDAINEALRCDPWRKRDWAVLVDANKQQLKTIEAVVDQHNLHDVTIILDWVHVLEYLWKTGRALPQDVDATIETRVQERALKIPSGKACDVAGGIMRSAFHKDLRGSRRKAVKETRHYLVKHTA